MKIGRKLKALRQLNSLTQTELGKKIKVGRSYIAQLEAGKTSLSKHLMHHIISVFGLSPNFFEESEQLNISIAETLDNYKNSLTNDSFISDQDYRVMIKTIDGVKELLKDF